MDKISPKTHAIYDFLRVDFDTALAKTTTERSEATITALAKLDIKLDLLYGCIDNVKLTICIDLDELRGQICVDRSTNVTPTTASVSPREPQPISQLPSFSGGASGSQGFRSD
ncbi:hypothetical protein ZWY2020_042919 [Hordeum vulgare]|nr:hypothetical protein ZWY2020_042919 [Hordeum vulgare]